MERLAGPDANMRARFVNSTSVVEWSIPRYRGWNLSLRGSKGGEKRSKGGEIPDSYRYQPKYIAQIPACKSIPAQIYRVFQLKNPTQIGSFPKSSKKHLRDRWLFCSFLTGLSTPPLHRERNEPLRITAIALRGSGGFALHFDPYVAPINQQTNHGLFDSWQLPLPTVCDMFQHFVIYSCKLKAKWKANERADWSPETRSR